MSDVKEFFDAVFGDGSGKLCLALLDSDRNPSRQHFLSWPEQADDAVEYVLAHADEDVYFTPTLFMAPNARRASAQWTSVVYGDADTCPVDSLKIAPSFVVHTSPEKTHVYWHIEGLHDPNEAEAWAHGVSIAHPKAETGFDNGWAANKLLRVPYTSNTKYSDPNSETYIEGQEPYKVSVEYTGEIYSEGEFAAAYTKADVQAVLNKSMGEVPSYAEALNSLTKTSQDLLDLISRKYEKHSAGSEALFLLQQELFRLGATDEAAFAICQKSGLNKFARDGRSNADELLWADILRARAKSEMEFRDATEPRHTRVTVQPEKKAKEIDFLKPEEKVNLKRTFIDDYKTWAASKTDAAAEYHVASAFMILSMVFSDFGHAIPDFGKLPLNLWFMVLGDTTRSRKSTTKKQMLRTLWALQKEGEYHYDLGSDFTGEGLTSELLQRANRSSLIHVDEAQDFIVGLERKPYLAGLRGQMTELYDGHVNGKLRATGTVKAASTAEISLGMFMMGIRDQLASVLTTEDFQSGFLTRFIYVEAEPPPRTKESDRIRQASKQDQVKDYVFEGFVARLDEARAHWEALTGGGSSPTIPVPATDAAMERLNEFVTDLLDEAEGSERADIVQASSQRLSLSILKAATLIAMSEMKDEVETDDMLAAINYCGSWFMHLVKMTNKVSESNWSRRMKSIEDFVVAAGGSAEWEKTYKNFRGDLKPREFVEVVNALEEAGIVKVVWENPEANKKGRRYIELEYV
ncbi:DNA primase [Arthrobacter phage Rings]|uniref:DNA primase n=9 Tax=Amigovirus amigo TaxID=1982100 RepID=A0A0U4IHJ3_9CAUD|nr:DNA primase [Arthrobacter phage Amigo]ALY08501.1 DNA primase [Arthrobacter phage Anansi]ALY09115.1 DNA primase [Arthrobacter phage Gorgeous]ALY10134.1 DNA primase [Arthrobacter phage Rings]ALY10396.1 DNA primase [Arthrobacter phage SorJuana]QFG08350.1 DNA primase [Arthrobacter phage Yeezus]QFG13399.1 DNA primase [Arthrobacter phage Ichor]QFG13917.1 DNA primase [Arthrobacter phage Jaek]QJD51704.1 DNA primase [Arthrobacter phage Boersma]